MRSQLEPINNNNKFNRNQIDNIETIRGHVQNNNRNGGQRTGDNEH